MSSGKDNRPRFFIVARQGRGRYLEEVAGLEGSVAVRPPEEGVAQARAGVLACPAFGEAEGFGDDAYEDTLASLGPPFLLAPAMDRVGDAGEGPGHGAACGPEVGEDSSFLG